MSAFILPKAHIDAIVTVAHYGPSDKPADVHWEEVKYMPFADAFPPPDDDTKEAYGYATPEDLTGRWLWAENVESVSYRYSEMSADDLGSPDTDAYAFHRHDVTTAQVFKALDCYEYQTCEHPAWQDTENSSRKFIEAIRSNLVGCVAGYNAAEWVIS